MRNTPQNPPLTRLHCTTMYCAEWARSSAVEHLTFNQRVVGSDPAGLTNLLCHTWQWHAPFDDGKGTGNRPGQ